MWPADWPVDWQEAEGGLLENEVILAYLFGLDSYVYLLRPTRAMLRQQFFQSTVTDSSDSNADSESESDSDSESESSSSTSSPSSLSSSSSVEEAVNVPTPMPRPMRNYNAVAETETESKSKKDVDESNSTQPNLVQVQDEWSAPLTAMTLTISGHAYTVESFNHKKDAVRLLNPYYCSDTDGDLQRQRLEKPLSALTFAGEDEENFERGRRENDKSVMRVSQLFRI